MMKIFLRAVLKDCLVGMKKNLPIKITILTGKIKSLKAPYFSPISLIAL
jgi:hypothetical protein